MICQYSPLNHEALLHIAGPDSLTFLQGQTTCDTRDLESGRAVPGAYCTPQGRVVCDFLLCQLGQDHYALRMRRDIRSGAGATFGKYIIFSKAELDSERDDWQVLACWGPDAALALGDIFGGTPQERYGSLNGDDFILVQMDEGGQQIECYLRDERAPQLMARMAEVMPLSSENSWQALQITSGIGRIEAATAEEFVPQMLNYDLTGHISFTKRCYTGQEVVARLHYRGKSKRRMYLAELPAASAAAAGSAVYTSGTQQSVGNIVNTASVEGRTVALVVATASGVDNGLYLAGQQDTNLVMGELPYALSPD